MRLLRKALLLVRVRQADNRFCNTATLTPGEHHVVFFHPSYQADVKDHPVDYHGQEKRDLTAKEEFQDGNFSRQ
jgi:hypothetical protein